MGPTKLDPIQAVQNISQMYEKDKKEGSQDWEDPVLSASLEANKDVRAQPPGKPVRMRILKYKRYRRCGIVLNVMPIALACFFCGIALP